MGILVDYTRKRRAEKRGGDALTRVEPKARPVSGASQEMGFGVMQAANMGYSRFDSGAGQFSFADSFRGTLLIDDREILGAVTG